MKIEILGSGGAVTTPRPGCFCQICKEARAEGVPYSRSGPSVFIHGPDILIDTPEESKAQLNRARIERVNACFYSHWHPDHVAGCRVWEMNMDFAHWPPQNKATDIYIPEQVGQDFRTKSGTWAQLKYLEKMETIRLFELSDGEVVRFDDFQISPFRLAEDYVYAFLFERETTRVLIAPDELFGWQPPAEMRGLDLAILPMGLTEFDPLTGVRLIPVEHPVFQHEATFHQTLGMIRSLQAKQIILTHIEEPMGLNYDKCLVLADRLQADGLNITFAYDRLVVEV